MSGRKLSNAQRRVLLLLAQGWVLRISRQYAPPEPFLRRGSATQSVRVNTVWSLQDRGLIQCTKEGFPWSNHGLTDAGRSAVKS